MQTILLVLQFLLALALIGVVLVQRSEGGALGMGGGGGGGMGGLMTSRGTANFLTRVTAFLAAAFMANSLLLAVLASQERGPGSILDDRLPVSAPISAPDQDPAGAAPAEPAVPLAE